MDLATGEVGHRRPFQLTGMRIERRKLFSPSMNGVFAILSRRKDDKLRFFEYHTKKLRLLNSNINQLQDATPCFEKLR